MIQVTIYKDSRNIIRRCTFSGHANYAYEGEDIVCSAVSILFINTVNAVERFTDDKFILKEDRKKNFFDFSFCKIPGEAAQLLLNTLVLGLNSIQHEYSSKYLRIIHKEVQ